MLQTPAMQTSPQEQSWLAEHEVTQKPVFSSQGQVPSQRLGRFTQVIWGLPMVPVGQLHCTPWFTTRHVAQEPQVVAPSHGSRHCLLMQAWLSGQDVSLRQPATHNRFSQIWLLPHLLSELHIVVHLPLTHRSSDRQLKSVLHLKTQVLASQVWEGWQSPRVTQGVTTW